MIDGTLARSWLFTPADRPDRFVPDPTRFARPDAAHTPSDDAVERARRVVTATEEAGGGRAVRVDGAMVDRPVLEAARAVRARADAFDGGTPVSG